MARDLYVLAALASPGSESAGERFLVALDEPRVGPALASLTSAGHRAVRCDAGGEELVRRSCGDCRVLLSDARRLEPVVERVRQIRAASAGVSVIVLGAEPSLEGVVPALESGLFDFVTRRFEPDALGEHLLDAVGRALEGARPPRSAAAPPRASAQRDPVKESLVGECSALALSRDDVRAAMRCDTPVLLRGENGTEKLAVARLLHETGERRDQPFVIVNTAHGEPEAELARAARSSNDARSGTLFFADVGQLAPVWHMALVELLSGLGAGPDPTRPRVVAALPHPPPPSWESGVIARLLDRIGYCRVHLPPLRERGRDIVLLAEHFAEQARLARGDAALRMTGSAIEALARYGWPGNVDELRLAIQHAASLCADSTIRVSDLPPGISLSLPGATDERGAPVQVQSLEEMELAYILRVLDAVGGNKASAARLLGVDRTTLYRKLQRQDGASPSSVPASHSEMPVSRRVRR